MNNFVRQLETDIANREPVAGVVKIYLVYPQGGSKMFNWSNREDIVSQLFDDSMRYTIERLVSKTSDDIWNNMMPDIEAYIAYLATSDGSGTNITPELIDVMKRVLEFGMEGKSI